MIRADETITGTTDAVSVCGRDAKIHTFTFGGTSSPFFLDFEELLSLLLERAPVTTVVPVFDTVLVVSLPPLRLRNIVQDYEEGLIEDGKWWVND